MVMGAIVGAAGLGPCLAAACSGKRLLLANKEALVVGGEFFMQAVEQGGARLLPIDSEHSAIFQSLPEDPQTWARRVRKLVLTADRDLNAPVEAFGGKSWGETLLTPTKIYVKPALAACKACDVHGIAHITGGGFIENIPRILPDGLSAQIERGTWPVLPVFTELVKLGGLGDRQAYNTFNMGVGMVFAVKAEEADKLIATLEAQGEKAYRIGRVAKTGEDGERLVLL